MNTNIARRAFLLVTVGVACAAFACPIMTHFGSTEDDAKSKAAVSVKGRKFSPEKLEITVGTTVTWTNGDAASHTIESGTPEAPTTLFNGKLPGDGGTFSYTFKEAGEFPYFCGKHNSMKGTVVVKAAK